MSPRPRRRPVVVLLVGVILVLAAIGAAVVLLKSSDRATRDTAAGPPAPGPATPSAAASVAPSASTSSSPTPTPTASASPSPAPSPSPQGAAPLTDLATLVPERVAGFSQTANAPARRLLRRPGVREARRVRYRHDGGSQVLHLVALHRGNAAAGRALRQRVAQALDRPGARVVDDTGLEDSDGVRRGRLLQVRTRSGDIIVLWRNRNLVARLGPGPARLHRRLYDAWPY